MLFTLCFVAVSLEVWNKQDMLMNTKHRNLTCKRNRLIPHVYSFRLESCQRIQMYENNTPSCIAFIFAILT